MDLVFSELMITASSQRVLRYCIGLISGLVETVAAFRWSSP